MSDIHPLPLVGHDLPLAKLHIWRSKALPYQWFWSHVCPNGQEHFGGWMHWENALKEGRRHMKTRHGVEI